jgi:hypothetical protein
MSSLRPLILSSLALSMLTATPARADDAAPAHAEAAPVTVVLRANTPRATLERRDSIATYAGVPIKDAAIFGLATWSPACTAPCEAALDPKYTYRIGGDGLVPSDSFVLPHDGSKLVMDAKMGSAAERVSGLGLSVMGAGGLVLGATALAISPILAADDVGSSTARAAVLGSGIAVTALSATVFGVGLYLWSHSETKVRPADMRGFTF